MALLVFRTLYNRRKKFWKDILLKEEEKNDFLLIKTELLTDSIIFFRQQFTK